jgi:hypothetical protein
MTHFANWISPELLRTLFITGLQSRGMKNLSVDQLVSLRIHGID